MVATKTMGQWISGLRQLRLGCPDEKVDRTIPIDDMTSVFDLYPYVRNYYKPAKDDPDPDPEIAKKVYLHCCNIENIQVDCVVNAANKELQAGAGVCGSIFKKAGPELYAIVKDMKPIDVGEAVITLPGKLPAQRIIHAVGPDISGRRLKDTDRANLKAAYRNSLDLCVKEGFKSIAFPSISTGIYEYPVPQARADSMSTVRAYLMDTERSHQLDAVIFVAWTARDYMGFLPYILRYFRPSN